MRREDCDDDRGGASLMRGGSRWRVLVRELCEETRVAGLLCDARDARGFARRAGLRRCTKRWSRCGALGHRLARRARRCVSVVVAAGRAATDCCARADAAPLASSPARVPATASATSRLRGGCSSVVADPSFRRLETAARGRRGCPQRPEPQGGGLGARRCGGRMMTILLLYVGVARSAAGNCPAACGAGSSTGSDKRLPK